MNQFLTILNKRSVVMGHFIAHRGRCYIGALWRNTIDPSTGSEWDAKESIIIGGKGSGDLEL